jgi:hypothetical protein
LYPFRCIGRFETYFDPFHPDTITPGGRKNNFCQSSWQWAENSQPYSTDYILKFSWFLGCNATLIVTQIIMFGVPEMILYIKTFLYIMRHNHSTALSGIFTPDTLKHRKQQNKLNILITFWAWLAQLITNIIYFVIVKIFFGKERFAHILLSVCTISLNFNVLPLFYLLMADEDLKASLINKDPFHFIKMLLGVELM